MPPHEVGFASFFLFEALPSACNGAIVLCRGDDLGGIRFSECDAACH